MRCSVRNCALKKDHSILQLKLTGVSAEMCLQVRALCVGFSAACKRAGMRGCALPWPRAPASFGFGLQQFEGRWGWSKHHPLCARLQAESFIIHAKTSMWSVVGHLHLWSLRVVLESHSCVIFLLKVHGLAQLPLTVRNSLVIGTQRRGHVAGRSGRDGHSWLLKGHHARNVAFLLDFAAALGHHAHYGTITVHWWLYFDVLRAGEMRRAGIKSSLNAGVARNAIAVCSFGAELFCHEAGAVRGRRGAMVVCWERWHRVSSRVHVGVGGAQIVHRAVWASCIGENKIQIQIVTQILVFLFVLIVQVLYHFKHGPARRDQFVHLSLPSLQEWGEKSRWEISDCKVFFRTKIYIFSKQINYSYMIFILLQAESKSRIFKKTNTHKTHTHNCVTLFQTYIFPGFFSLVWESRKWR